MSRSVTGDRAVLTAHTAAATVSAAARISVGFVGSIKRRSRSVRPGAGLSGERAPRSESGIVRISSAEARLVGAPAVEGARTAGEGARTASKPEAPAAAMGMAAPATGAGILLPEDSPTTGDSPSDAQAAAPSSPTAIPAVRSGASPSAAEAPSASSAPATDRAAAKCAFTFSAEATAAAETAVSHAQVLPAIAFSSE